MPGSTWRRVIHGSMICPPCVWPLTMIVPAPCAGGSKAAVSGWCMTTSRGAVAGSSSKRAISAFGLPPHKSLRPTSSQPLKWLALPSSNCTPVCCKACCKGKARSGPGACVSWLPSTPNTGCRMRLSGAHTAPRSRCGSYVQSPATTTASTSSALRASTKRSNCQLRTNRPTCISATSAMRSGCAAAFDNALGATLAAASFDRNSMRCVRTSSKRGSSKPL